MAGITTISKTDRDLSLALDLGVDTSTFLGIGEYGTSQHLVEVRRQITNTLFVSNPPSYDAQYSSIENNSKYAQLFPFVDSDLEIMRLRVKVRQYKQLSSYQWPELKVKTYRLGQKSIEIAKLRWMLIKLDDLSDKKLSAYREQVYDPSIASAIKRFQIRHGLKQSGKLTIETVDLLNVNPSVRVIQLQQTLKDKLASIQYLQKIYVEINIPEFKLRVKGDDTTNLEMSVIVGASNNKTPLLQTYINQLTINPTWTPPRSIIYKELLVNLKKAPTSLQREQFVLVKIGNNKEVKSLEGMSANQLEIELRKYKLVQMSGYKNALGKYRFTIPNSKMIFLHDTPNKNAFKKRNRALSHGCIRLANPGLFAEYLMNRENVKSRNILSSARRGEATVDIKLKNPLPIIITYQNIWVDDKNLLQIRPDIYNREVRK
ncbi:peptidoglycan-binding protein [Shewanella sp. GutCb]|uniref:L,D-transpeptidase family protein n=1 Tax=Shewanella sp. GutCb TaxID=2058315 RepID=UPI000C7BA79E|nr:L,D-transpeptidase family protein [Shewanella sp. GutCb]PKG73789.1 peptidoglycan-binding protein [Shewanella sp. GutCb]